MVPTIVVITVATNLRILATLAQLIFLFFILNNFINPYTIAYVFSGAEKSNKRDIHPAKASPRGEDAVDYEGKPSASKFLYDSQSLRPGG